MTSESDLALLARKHGTDKEGVHWYARHYAQHLSPFRGRSINILEVGVGGYDDPNIGGASLRMWKEYFPAAEIFGVDFYDKSGLEEERIRIFQGDQEDKAFLDRVNAAAGGFDIIIDDGSHVPRHVLATFNHLFPLLRTGGIYAVEDLQTSYWPCLGGSSTDLNAPETSMGYFKSLLDGLNHVEFHRPGYQPTYFDKTIVAMHFYHNLVFIEKGENDELSNVVNNFRLPKEFGGGDPEEIGGDDLLDP